MTGIRMLLGMWLGLGLVLAGCHKGGDHKDGSPTRIVYAGKTTAAVITTDNAMSFVDFIIGDDFFAPPTDQLTSAAAAMAPAALKAISRLERPAPAAADTAIPIDQTIPGLVSGQARYTGFLNPDGSGTLTILFNNFNDGDDLTLDGTATLAILTVDPNSGLVTALSLELKPLYFSSSDSHFGLDGSLHFSLSPTLDQATDRFNLDGSNLLTQETFRLENLVINTSCDDLAVPTQCSESYSGRVYLAPAGYVELSQSSPLQYNTIGRFNVDIPEAGGPLLLSGAERSAVRLQPLSISKVQIAVDSNGDGLFENVETRFWREVAGVVYTFETAFGSTGFDEGRSAMETNDGGYIVAGYTNTNGPDGLDASLVKTDAIGRVEWQQGYGGSDDQEAWAVLQTADGGFLLVGSSATTVASSRRGLLLRTDASGVPLWSTSLAGELESRMYGAIAADDGGFLVVGAIESYSPATGLVGFGGDDVYLAKFSADGQPVWQQRFGGNARDVATSIKRAADGDYLLVGTTESMDFSTYREQIYLLRTDPGGNLRWEAHYGGELSDYGYDLVEEPGGALVISGYAATLASGNLASLTKTDGAGQLLWSQTYSQTDSLYHRNGVTRAAAGGYVLASDDGFDVILTKTDQGGVQQWERRFNWTSFLTACTASSVSLTSDDGFVIAGSAWPLAGKDMYLIKTDANGNR